MPELYFKGKEFVYNHHLTVPYRPLETHPDKSVGEDSGNLIIHGDNLHALKALLPHYAGKVDCIFIDPPYNTGNESWSYNDNVNSPIMREWLSTNPVNKEDMLRHDKWACMMYPRLKLLKELIAEDGFIAVTIDDNELDNLLYVMNEVFDADNRLACAVWLSDPSGGKQKSALRVGHEYVVIYGGGDPSLTKEEKVAASLELEDQRGPYAKGRELNKWGANSFRKDRQSMFFPMKSPDGTEVWPIRNDGQEGCWRFGKDSRLVHDVLEDPEAAHWEMRPFDVGVTVNGARERWVPYEKIRDINKAFGWSTWLDKIATNADGTKVIKQIFGKKVFETPKPVELMEWIIGLSGNSDAIVLDSFAGSGTTAHAVLSLNSKDGGSRRFILVESEDYAESLTLERVRRVISGYEFQGTQKEELLRQKVNFTMLKQSQKLLREIEHIEQVKGARFDSISKTIKNDELLVIGEKKITERTEGLGGGFTYCTLGQPLDLDKLLTGEHLPDFRSIGAWLFHTATGVALPPRRGEASAPTASPGGEGPPGGVKQSKAGETGESCFAPTDARTDDAIIAKWYLGESPSYHVWLIYRPDLDWLKSRDGALTLTLAEKIAATDKEKRHLVFAPARFVASKHLLPLGVEHAPLPFALYRFEKD